MDKYTKHFTTTAQNYEQLVKVVELQKSTVNEVNEVNEANEINIINSPNLCKKDKKSYNESCKLPVDQNITLDNQLNIRVQDDLKSKKIEKSLTISAQNQDNILKKENKISSNELKNNSLQFDIKGQCQLEKRGINEDIKIQQKVQNTPTPLKMKFIQINPLDSTPTNQDAEKKVVYPPIKINQEKSKYPGNVVDNNNENLQSNSHMLDSSNLYTKNNPQVPKNLIQTRKNDERRDKLDEKNISDSRINLEVFIPIPPKPVIQKEENLFDKHFGIPKEPNDIIENFKDKSRRASMDRKSMEIKKGITPFDQISDSIRDKIDQNRQNLKSKTLQDDLIAKSAYLSSKDKFISKMQVQIPFQVSATDHNPYAVPVSVQNSSMAKYQYSNKNYEESYQVLQNKIRFPNKQNLSNQNALERGLAPSLNERNNLDHNLRVAEDRNYNRKEKRNGFETPIDTQIPLKKMKPSIDQDLKSAEKVELMKNLFGFDQAQHFKAEMNNAQEIRKVTKFNQVNNNVALQKAISLPNKMVHQSKNPSNPNYQMCNIQNPNIHLNNNPQVNKNNISSYTLVNYKNQNFIR